MCDPAPRRHARDLEAVGRAARRDHSRRRKSPPVQNGLGTDRSFPRDSEEKRKRKRTGSHKKRWNVSTLCRYVCVWYVALATSCVPSPSPGDALTNDAWRRSATRRLIDTTVTSRAARLLYICRWPTFRCTQRREGGAL
jgi:hypothetical protein